MRNVVWLKLAAGRNFMPNGKVVTARVASSKSVLTHWKCAKCGSFFSIESSQSIDTLGCLICRDTLLDFCGSFDPFSETTSQDDSCSDYDSGEW